MAFLEGGLGETILWPAKNGFPQKYFVLKKDSGGGAAGVPEGCLLLDLFRVVLHGVIQHFLGRQVAHEHHLDIGL